MRVSICRHWIGGITLGVALLGMTMLGERAFAQAAPRLSEITQADLTKIPSGCSFVVYDKSHQIVAISTTPLGPHVSFWFKIDGKLIEAGGVARRTKEPGFILLWSGKVAGTVITITRGQPDGNRNKPGEDSLFHGPAKLVTPAGSQDMSWEAGC